MIIDDNRLETLLAASACSAMRASQILLLARSGILTEQQALQAASLTDSEWRSALKTLSGAAKTSKHRDDDEEDDDGENEQELARIARTSGTSVGKLRKAIATKRAAESSGDVDMASLKRNGLADDYRAHAPGPLSGETNNKCGTRSLRIESDGEREQGVLRQLRALEGGK